MANEILAYMLAGVVGVLYAIITAIWRRYSLEDGSTAFSVVIGNGLVVAVFAAMWGLEVAASLLALMAIMGIPQIIGYHIDYALRNRLD